MVGAALARGRSMAIPAVAPASVVVRSSHPDGSGGLRPIGRFAIDLALHDLVGKLLGILTVKGGTNRIIEYFGPGAASISTTGKGTITNMGAELGATTSIFPFDDHMERYLRGTEREALADLARENADLLRPDDEVAEQHRRDRRTRIRHQTLDEGLLPPVLQKPFIEGGGLDRDAQLEVQVGQELFLFGRQGHQKTVDGQGSQGLDRLPGVQRGSRGAAAVAGAALPRPLPSPRPPPGRRDELQQHDLRPDPQPQRQDRGADPRGDEDGEARPLDQTVGVLAAVPRGDDGSADPGQRHLSAVGVSRQHQVHALFA